LCRVFLLAAEQGPIGLANWQVAKRLCPRPLD